MKKSINEYFYFFATAILLVSNLIIIIAVEKKSSSALTVGFVMFSIIFVVSVLKMLHSLYKFLRAKMNKRTAS